MDPANSVAGLLAAGATALVKGALSTAAKDAWAAMRNRLRDRYPSVEIDRLEQQPDSRSRRAQIEEELAATKASQDPELLLLITRIAEELQRAGPRAGVDIRGIEAAEVVVRDITAGRDVHISGIISGTGNIISGARTTGVEPTEPWPQPSTPRR